MILAQKDDIKAFELLYERLKNSLYSYVYNTIFNKDGAMDIIQESFLKIYKNRKLYRREYKVTTWVWRIVRNTTIDHLRLKDPLKNTKDSTTEEPIIETLESEQDSLEEEYDNRIKTEVLQRCFNELPPLYREALSLRVFGDLSYKEIAEIMNKTIPAIKALIHKGKKSLEQSAKQIAGESYE